LWCSLKGWSKKLHCILPADSSVPFYAWTICKRDSKTAMKFDIKITCATSRKVWETLLCTLGSVPKNMERFIEVYRFLFCFPFSFYTRQYSDCSKLLLTACWPNGHINTSSPSIILLLFHKILYKYEYTQK
jgi:hypothetical protein